MNPNWAEQVTAIATAIGCIGLTSTLVLAVLAGRQVREAQRGRHRAAGSRSSGAGTSPR